MSLLKRAHLTGGQITLANGRNLVHRAISIDGVERRRGELKAWIVRPRLQETKGSDMPQMRFA